MAILEEFCIVSADIQWLYYSDERIMAHGPLILLLAFYLLMFKGTPVGTTGGGCGRAGNGEGLELVEQVLLLNVTRRCICSYSYTFVHFVLRKYCFCFMILCLKIRLWRSVFHDCDHCYVSLFYSIYDAHLYVAFPSYSLLMYVSDGVKRTELFLRTLRKNLDKFFLVSLKK